MCLIVEPIMALSARVREKSPAIAQRWLADALAAYPADSAAAFRRQQDRFANPVGHALRAGTRAAVEALLEGREPEEICVHLDEIVKIRAVQEFEPSQAVSFVFLLKDAIRAELGGGDPGSGLSTDLADLDQRIDRVALAVFDLYMRYRGQVYELRIREVKRSVAALAERMNRRNPLPACDQELLQLGTSECGGPKRGDGR
jgi:hypothetical protein